MSQAATKMLVLQSGKWTWPNGTPDELKTLYGLFLRCPCGCGGALGGGAVIERSSPRSVTLRCTNCGLHWTMTLHQLAKAAKRHVENGGWPGHDLKYSKHLAGMLAYFAEAVPETRGRVPAGGELASEGGEG